MEKSWNLNPIYKGFESKEYKDDLSNLEKQIQSITNWTSENLTSSNLDEVKVINTIEKYVALVNDFEKYYNLLTYAELTLSVDSLNETATKMLDIVESMFTELSKPQVMFKAFIKNIDNIENLIKKSDILKEHEFFILEQKELSNYMLSEDEEIIMTKMSITGSNAWEKLRSQLTSVLMVDMVYEGVQKSFPITVIRNMAYESSQKTRKDAYEAELKSYENIDKSIAFALNGIKGEVITTSKLRGYDSVLDMTLVNSRMKKETLDAMFEAIKQKLPVFRKYLKHKAKLLGHKNGLPFYDLFAPIGNVEMRFTYEEAAEFIIKNFSNFSERLGQFAKRAFEESWIDVEPKRGKIGGAFCCNIHPIKESRIMTNFTGSFQDVLTLAHELGHAYHGYCLDNETALNSEYTMPIAETASIFCESIVSSACLKTASKEQAVSILENSVSGATQTIIDIYSRFLFEDEFIKRREKGILSSEEISSIMLDAQKEAYGDGLDENFLHKYMWLIKPHYYSANTNYYNFPYAYGNLFSNGLYAKYLKGGDKFIVEYDSLLKATGKNSLEDIGKKVGIDVTDVQFWISSLEIIEEEIEEFISLS